MEAFQTVTSLKAHIQERKKQGREIGFVPTMGALHEGHLSLIRAAKERSGVCVCSIFVNPTQFDEPSDLSTYPRTIEEDKEKLKAQEVEVLFLPTVKEMYPNGFDEELPYSFAPLDQVLEGVYRPGHFQGVAQVVSKLLQAVQPHSIYLGQKDYQQFLIIRSLIRQMEISTTPVCCPIIREDDGLALSSRNVRLNQKERQDATKIYQTLLNTKERFGHKPVRQLQKEGKKALQEVPSIQSVDYFAIVNALNLQPVKQAPEATDIIACTAVRMEHARLIDNLFLKRETVK